MSKESNTLYSGLKLAAILAAAVVATGCVSPKSTSTQAPAPVEPVVVSEPAIPAPAPVTSWTVAAGNHLWGIAGTWDVFNVPEKWPLLYKANLDTIKDADLIYPGQVLDIPRDSSAPEVDAAINHAKNRGAWTVGSVEISDTQYLNNSS